MSELEHAVLGDIFLACAVALFVVGIPGYTLLRRLRPARPGRKQGLVDTGALGLIDLVGIGIFFGFYAFFWTQIPKVEDRSLTALGILDSMLFHVLCVSIVVGLLAWRTRLADFFGLRWRQWPLVFAIVPMVLLVMWILSAGLMWSGYFDLMTRTFGDDPVQESVRALQESEDPLAVGLLVLAACFVAPVAEEIVFRGYIYAGVKRFTDRVFALVFSSLFFAAVHMNVASLLPLFILALLLAFVYELTGSLWAPIAVHFAFNSATVVVNLFLRFVSPESLEAIENL